MHPWQPSNTMRLAHCEPVDYLAAVGYWHVLGDAQSPVADEDDPGSWESARAADHRLVRERLTAEKPEQRSGDKQGIASPFRITWPDRMPGLRTWSGNQTLAKLIAKMQSALTIEALSEAGNDLATVCVPLKGTSGLDRSAAQTALEMGFSANELDMPIYQRVAVELLAIIGLETLPLVSWDTRKCGWIHDGRLWRMTVEHRIEGYYRWGQAKLIDITT